MMAAANGFAWFRQASAVSPSVFFRIARTDPRYTIPRLP